MTSSPQIFISWSGKESKQVAERMRSWLPLVVDSAELWLSSRDLPEGARWSHELFTRLESSQFGILVVTPQNLTSSWMLFEAGALSKNLKEGRVLPYLVGLSPGELQGPLQHFQAVEANEIGTLRLATFINDASSSPIEADVFLQRFAAFWPEFSEFLETLSDIADHAIEASREDPIRRMEAKLGETTDMLRELVRVLIPSGEAPHESPTSECDETALAALEGAWLYQPSGGHGYARIVNGDLLVPYCYGGDDKLTGVYYDWKRMGDFWFCRFKWIRGQAMQGFAFIRQISQSVVEGSWWYDEEVPPSTPSLELMRELEPLPGGGALIEGTEPPPGGSAIRWQRREAKEFPKWATDYFADPQAAQTSSD